MEPTGHTDDHKESDTFLPVLNWMHSLNQFDKNEQFVQSLLEQETILVEPPTTFLLPFPHTVHNMNQQFACM